MSKVKKAVITAAGRGTRQYPASTVIPKEMFPLVDRDGLTKPVIQIIGEEAIESGIEEICIVTQSGDEKIYRDYFRALEGESAAALAGKDWAMLAGEKLADFGRRLHFAVQASPEGFGHAVYQAKSFVGNEPFLLLLGDHVYVSDTKDRCARQLLSVFEEQELDALSAVQPGVERSLHHFGVIQGQPIDLDRGIFQARKIVEKPSIDLARRELVTPGVPAGNFLTHFGMHVFSPKIFECLEELISGNVREKGEVQLTSAQELLRRRSEKYWCMIARGQRYDMGIPYGLMETQIGLGLQGIHRAEICEAITRILAAQNKQ